jgi:hypothetical protein
MSEPLEEEVRTSIAVDPRKLAALRLVRDLELPEGAIAGDLVRCAVFDRRHEHPEPTQLRSVDVVYFDPERTEAAVDESLTLELVAQASRRPWRVRNLARERPEAAGLAEALDVFDATAAAVAVRLGPREVIEVVAPFGLSDLVAGVVRPVASARAPHLRRRVADERWTKRYPQLVLEGLHPG